MTNVRIVGHVDHHDIADYYRLIDMVVVPRVPQWLCKFVTPLKPFKKAMGGGVPLAVSGTSCAARNRQRQEWIRRPSHRIPRQSRRSLNVLIN